ncbi:MAG: hypothetical protein OSA98_04370 [Rubripirellula sp.]|nr:hypothetical protein [Rubripirellula sp.]
MNERLDEICFLPPAADTPWAGAPENDLSTMVARADGEQVAIDLPLFWYDPPWSQIGIETANVIASAVARLGVTVSALRSDLSLADREPELHQVITDEAADDSNPGAVFLPRMIPYRPERYGLNGRDFDGARVVDVRLAMRRDMAGRFAFTPDQIERWEATDDDSPLAGGGWVPVASFPPDVDGMHNLSGKFSQLRLLSQDAAVFVSISPHRLTTELPAVLASQPDGVVLRLGELNLSGLALAGFVQQARRMMDDQQCGHVPLWIVPGKITVDDAAKLMALGATAVAIDSWCEVLLDDVRDSEQNHNASFSYSSLSASNHQQWVDWIECDLASQVERFGGLLHSMRYQPPGQRLAAFSQEWAETLDLVSLNLPFDSDA